MESRTLSLLEFPKVLERLANMAASEPAAAACRAIAPLGGLAFQVIGFSQASEFGNIDQIIHGVFSGIPLCDNGINN